jgi:two-component system cell cycle sensor histidine kinase/response regulator CckA
VSERLRVLLVEDNPGDADLIRELLPRSGPLSFEVEHATRLSLATELVQTGPFDVILLDLGLPDSFGLDTVRTMLRLAPSVAIVVLTGNSDEALALSAIQEGAQDYVVKGPLTGELLSRVIVYGRERHQAARRLRESEARLKLTLEAVNDGVWDWDVPSGQAVFSPHWYDMLGYQPYEFAQTYDSWRSLIHPDDIGPTEEKIARHLATGSSYSIELRMLAKGGDWRWILTRGRVIERDGDGGPVRLVGTHSDITERKQAEQALRELDEQLRQSQKMEAVGQLAGGIAHDFNNLLTTIIGYGDLLLARPDLADESVRRDMQEIKHAAERAAALTAQILAFSRRQALRPRVVCLNEVLTGLEPLLQRTLGETIELVSLQQPDLGSAEVDLHQFEQVVMNLALNARDAMKSGGRLTLETGNVELHKEYCLTHPETRPGSFVMLAVSDTGTGMDKATRERVFEPFFTTKAPGEGTGLGLATVYGIVKQSNGSISVYTEPGKGTTFKIYLPRVGAPVQEENGPASVGVVQTAGDETILLVEDEVSVRKLAVRLLRDLGYHVLRDGRGSLGGAGRDWRQTGSAPHRSGSAGRSARQRPCSRSARLQA